MSTPTPELSTTEVSAANYVARLDEKAKQLALETGEPNLERRVHPRFVVRRPAMLIPVFANMHPGPELTGQVVDVGRGGIGIQLQGEPEVPSRYCVVGVQATSLAYFYATLEVRSIRPLEGGLRLGGEFINGSMDPLDPEGLAPRLDPDRMRLAPCVDPSVLDKWIARGVMVPKELDVVKSCPRCRALPTFRDGCLKCGSPRTTSAKLIHHFACAHVARAEEFDAGGALSCPKCRARNLIVGSDFEHLDGPTKCRECDWSDAQPGTIAECLMCGLRFAACDAVNEEVTQLYVARLDPLALLDEKQ